MWKRKFDIDTTQKISKKAKLECEPARSIEKAGCNTSVSTNNSVKIMPRRRCHQPEGMYKST